MNIATIATLALLAPLGQAPSSPAERPATYVIVHGAWGGGWDWRRVEALLRARGHEVERVTLTGLGERVHLARPDIGLETHITDVVNAILWDGLRDVVLVGHSYGGMVITGAADRVPERIGRLVYVDAMVPESGERVIDIMGPDMPAFVKKHTRKGFIVPPWGRPDAPLPRDAPQPVKTFTDRLLLGNAAARRLPATYILTVDAGRTEDDFDRFAERARARGWPVVRMTANHVPERSAPEELVELLLK
jgi:pimeloyl-ACP methyl ester carboxylesterase